MHLEMSSTKLRPFCEHVISASRALDYIHYKLKCLKEWRHFTFNQMYSAFVCHIMNYVSGIMAVKPFENLDKKLVETTQVLLSCT